MAKPVLYQILPNRWRGRDSGVMDCPPRSPDQVKTYSVSSPETPISNIMNLSHHNLTISEIYVFSKGLTFASTHKLNHFEFTSDALAFTQNSCLKFYYFQHHEPVNQPLPRRFLYLNLNLLGIFQNFLINIL